MNTRSLKQFFARISIFALDLFWVIVSFVIAFLLRRYAPEYLPLKQLFIKDVDDFLIKNWWLVLIYMLVYLSQGLYSKNRTFWEETRILLNGTIIATFINFAIVALAKLSPYISRLILVLQPLVLLLTLPLLKYFFKKFLYNLGLWQLPLLEVRLNTKKSLKNVFKVNKYLGYKVVDSYAFSLKNREDVDKVYEFLKGKLSSKKYSGVLFSVQILGDPNISLLIEKTFFLVSKILIIPDFIGFDVLSATISHLMYENLFVFDTNKGLNKRSNRIIKRIIDILAGIVLLVFFGPLLLLAMLITFISDGLPVFYKHKRFGEKGKIFDFFKVRSMYLDGDTKRLPEFLRKHPEYKEIWDKYQKLPEEVDPRLIKGGAFIRKTKIDELAQVINLLKGDMSLVGPRPYLLRERKLMGDYFDRILAVKPGITGLWQVSGGNERTFKERLQIDVWYVQNWSLWLDIVIILKTILLFLKHGKRKRKNNKKAS